MSSQINMSEPMCLIENSDQQLLVNQEALKILSTIKQKVVVVAIVGLYRTGKSYLMNSLAGKKRGFSLGSTIQSHTKGIWMWCVPHPKKPGHTLVLLDTEGLEDVEKGDNQNDCWIFALAVLFSSTFIYNSMGTINQHAMDQLQYPFIVVKNSPKPRRTASLFYQQTGLQCLVLTYVNAISNGELPCMENAVLTLARIENSAAVQKAIAHYDQQMRQKMQLPTETLRELLDLHRVVEKEAIEVFMKNSFKDEDQKFQRELGAQLEGKRDVVIKKNEDVSSDRCSALLQDIFAPLEEEVKQGAFSKPGGYYVFLQKKQELENKYKQAPGKGVQAEEMLKKYFESKEDVAATLLKTDQSLTEQEKQIEVERIKVEAAEAMNRELQEMQKKTELLMEQKEKSYQEHVRQMTEKMEQEREQLMAENNKTISLKLKVFDHIISISSWVPVKPKVCQKTEPTPHIHQEKVFRPPKVE
ncbi:guanylate-binding protein 1-like [Nannospalax galili]|uniref:guanylate-binding protein 1-like n=1 Tax=Nannospalax galili TaxID=1026970 RepID=UPI00111BD249|nr:guanylate-binding protein 1-like [Nannospalax galili]